MGNSLLFNCIAIIALILFGGCCPRVYLSDQRSGLLYGPVPLRNSGEIRILDHLKGLIVLTTVRPTRQEINILRQLHAIHLPAMSFDQVPIKEAVLRIQEMITHQADIKVNSLQIVVDDDAFEECRSIPHGTLDPEKTDWFNLSSEDVHQLIKPPVVSFSIPDGTTVFDVIEVLTIVVPCKVFIGNGHVYIQPEGNHPVNPPVL